MPDEGRMVHSGFQATDFAVALSRPRRREPIGVGDGKSGMPLERLVLADGRVVVTKRIRPGGDWLMRNTHDEGRAAQMWWRGILAEILPILDHGVIGVLDDAPGWLLVMRDLSEWICTDGRRISRAESRRIIAAFHDLHLAFADRRLDDLCPLRDRYTVLSPAMSERERDGDALVPKLVGRGWDIFTTVVDADVGDAVMALLHDPSPLAAALEQRPATLVHGDMKMANLGIAPHAVIAIDWGSMTGIAPAAVDWAWYLATAASSIDADRDAVLADIRDVEGEHHDPVGLELALLGALVQLGWNKALDARQHPDPAVRAREAADLDWWVDSARHTLNHQNL